MLRFSNWAVFKCLECAFVLSSNYPSENSLPFRTVVKFFAFGLLSTELAR